MRRLPRSPLPRRESSVLSVSNCRTMRDPVAPTAARTASSPRRCAARASRRFATLAQVMTRMSSAAPATASKPLRTPPVTASLSGFTFMPTPGYSLGCCRARLAPSTPSSRTADWRSTPARSRAMTVRCRHARQAHGSVAASWSGSHACASGTSASRNAGGMMPMTVAGLSSMSMVRPTIDRSPPNRLRQKPSLRMMTCPPLGASSPRLNRRPIAA